MYYTSAQFVYEYITYVVCYIDIKVRIILDVLHNKIYIWFQIGLLPTVPVTLVCQNGPVVLHLSSI